MFRFIIAAVFFMIIGCTSTGNLSNRNYSQLYELDADFYPVALLTHQNDTLSELIYKIDLQSIGYKRPEPELEFSSNLKIIYRVIYDDNKSSFNDSGSVFVKLPKSEITEHINSIILSIEKGHSGIVDLRFKDINSSVDFQIPIRFNRKTGITRDDYKMYVSKDNSKTPIFSPHIGMGSEFSIHCNNSAIKLHQVRFYKESFPLAPPPFAMYNPKPFKYKADSVYYKYGNPFSIKLPGKGFYHIVADTSQRQGLTLYSFGEGFPEISSAKDMLGPLRYLCTKKEYEDMEKAENPKAAMDSYWLKVGREADRARELIKVFYHRVQHANKYFTSHKEGWKTDRGMIYIVFGPPDVVYKSSYNESWVYGEENNFMSLSFNFHYVQNPFTDNDFMLNRSPIYKTNYYRAVDYWRQGRVG